MNIYNTYDKKGQDKVLKILPKLFSGYTLNIEQHIEDNGKVDIFMSASTETKLYKYAIEAKDRWHPHTAFADEGWILEEDKYIELMEYYKQGYRPIYFNTFNDGTYVVWDVSKCKFTKGSKTSRRKTVEDKGKVTRDRLFVKVADCTCSGTTS